MLGSGVRETSPSTRLGRGARVSGDVDARVSVIMSIFEIARAARCVGGETGHGRARRRRDARGMETREVYKGTRPPPPPPPPRRSSGDEATRATGGKRTRADGTHDENEGDDTGARAGAAFELPSEDAGVDFSMKMWTKEGERVSKSRPARIQYDPETGPRIRRSSDEATNRDFNVWWGKSTSRGFHDTPRAVTRCAPILDAGTTRGDAAGVTALCYHFARGCCASGEACEYLHRLPTAFDDAHNHMMLDIFGRPKHHCERNDNDGTGSYMRVGRTLYMFFGGSVDPNWDAKRVYDEVSAQFGEFGPIEDVSVKFERRFAFVRFKFRASAEFAKEAMNGQTLWPRDDAEPLTVRWANDDPNPIAIVRVANETEEKVRDMFLRSEKAQAMMREAKRQMLGRNDDDGDDTKDDAKDVVEVSFDPADYDDDEEAQ